MISVPNIDEEAARLTDKDGWIIRHEFLKFAVTTELLKVEFQDRVFQKVEVDKTEQSGSRAKKDSKSKVSTVNAFTTMSLDIKVQ